MIKEENMYSYFLKVINESLLSIFIMLLIDMYFLDKGALIIGVADKRPLIQRALL